MHSLSWTLLSLLCLCASCATDAATGVMRDRTGSEPDPPWSDGGIRPGRPEPEVDARGIHKLYPTAPGGREWYLPADAEVASDEWNVENNPVQRVRDGVFHTSGHDGETRLIVSSPEGRAWWRNVEMTGYFRYTAAHDSHGQERHWELLARSEQHTSSRSVAASHINGGVSAPNGTPQWKGLPRGEALLNGPCLGSSYHGNVYVAGHALLEKEVSHTEGYAEPRSETPRTMLANPLGRWFGLKFVLRNADDNRRVHLELWLDADADQSWVKIAETDDTPGSWSAPQVTLDGCAAPPFSYAPDELLTWAGPWITFRSDSIEMDFRDLSAREISPL